MKSNTNNGNSSKSTKTLFDVVSAVVKTYYPCPDDFLIDLNRTANAGKEACVFEIMKNIANEGLKTHAIQEYLVVEDKGGKYLVANEITSTGNVHTKLFGVIKASDGNKHFVTKGVNGSPVFFNTLVQIAADNFKKNGRLYNLPQKTNYDLKSQELVLKTFQKLYFSQAEYIYQMHYPIEFINLTQQSMKQYIAEQPPKIIPQEIDLKLSHLDIMQKLLKNNHGLVIGNSHTDIATIDYLTATMPSLKQSGVTHLFLEQTSLLTGAFNIFNDPSSEFYGDLQVLNNCKQKVFRSEWREQEIAIDRLIVAANRCGIKVLPVDKSRGSGETFNKVMHVQSSDGVMAYNIMMNMCGGAKFIDLVGLGHNKVAELINVPMMIMATQDRINSLGCKVGINQSGVLEENGSFKTDVMMLPPSQWVIANLKRVQELQEVYNLKFIEREVEKSQMLQLLLLNAINFHLCGHNNTIFQFGVTVFAACSMIEKGERGVKVFMNEFENVLGQMTRQQYCPQLLCGAI